MNTVLSYEHFVAQKTQTYHAKHDGAMRQITRKPAVNAQMLSLLYT